MNETSFPMQHFLSVLLPSRSNSVISVFTTCLGFILWICTESLVLAQSQGNAGLQLTEESTTEKAVSLLIAKCAECHGANKQEAGLRLDTPEGLLTGGDSGEVIVRGAADKSKLIEYVRGDGGSVMPPEGDRLSAAEVELLRSWINSGAKWSSSRGPMNTGLPEKHWAFRPVEKPALPAERIDHWCHNEVDRFIADRLASKSLAPATLAEPATLIRRLSFDLRGLPPDVDEVDRFLASNDPMRYERLVDRYLASPEFGERWSRHWLDRTQYGESSGCVIDVVRLYPWRWRDWVVEKINDDLPFDQFTKLQIAGDLIAGESRDARTATGFYRNALTNHEAGTDPYHEFSKTTVDRTNLVAATWLELTVGCAECHSHKYDPITQRDFYRLYAFFNNLQDRFIDDANEQDRGQAQQIQQHLKQLAAEYAANEVPSQLAWEKSVQELPEFWRSPVHYEPRSLRTSAFAQVHPRDDGSMDIDGRIRKRDELILVFETDLPEVNAIRIELLPSADRFHSGPGRGWAGSCILTSASVSRANVDGSDIEVANVAQILTDYCQAGYDAQDALQPLADEKNTGWAIDHKGLSHSAVLRLEKPLRHEGSRVKVMLAFNSGEGRIPARFKLTAGNVATHLLKDQVVPSDIRELVRIPTSHRNELQRATIKRYFQSTYGANSIELAEWNQALDQTASWISPRGAEVVEESSMAKPALVRLRGDFHRPGPEVYPGLPVAFDPSGATDLKARDENQAGARSAMLNRKDLADWIVNRQNPLTARVMVNDVWQHLFGVGLVRTAGDFGKQGDPPTHPELLDWLAFQLMHEDGWSRKALIRRIVTSATYQQSASSHESLLKDPQNSLFGRQNRFRLEAEVLRDTILNRAGLLVSSQGGPTFHPAEPNDANAYYEWDQKHLLPTSDALYRRGLYIAARRTIGDPMLTGFDAPSGNNSCPARQRTNTPLQAVSLLNDPLMIEAAREIGRRFQPNSEAQSSVVLVELWKHCLGRSPTEDELRQLRQLHADLLAIPSLNGSDEVWFMIARTVINLDEMTTRE